MYEKDIYEKDVYEKDVHMQDVYEETYYGNLNNDARGESKKSYKNSSDNITGTSARVSLRAP